MFLPRNVLRKATNFDELVRKAAAESGAPRESDFVDDVFTSLREIDKWIPALSNLAFVENADTQTEDESDVDTKPLAARTQKAARTTGTPRGLRKRKVFI